MPNSVESTGRTERQWDLAAIERSPTNVDGMYVMQAQLSPTALLPACWVLAWNSNPNQYVWRVSFSTDTAIPWTLYFNFGTPALSGSTAVKIGNTGANPGSLSQAQVVAAPSVHNPIIGGYAGASSFTECLGNVPLVTPFQLSLVLATGAVAANCYCSIWWSEYID